MKLSWISEKAASEMLDYQPRTLRKMILKGEQFSLKVAHIGDDRERLRKEKTGSKKAGLTNP